MAKEVLRSAAVSRIRGSHSAAPHHKSVLTARMAPERSTVSSLVTVPFCVYYTHPLPFCQETRAGIFAAERGSDRDVTTGTA